MKTCCQSPLRCGSRIARPTRIRTIGWPALPPRVTQSPTHAQNRRQSDCRSVAFDHVKQGHGTLVATAAASGHTRLSISHKAPVRLVPSPPNRNAVAARCSWGHYGGGLAAGDGAHVSVHVQPRATVHLTTQGGANRIYKPSLRMHHPEAVTHTSLHATVDAHATFVYTPDPTSLHTDSRLRQTSVYTLHPTASLVAIDWIAAGRLHWIPPPTMPNTSSSTPPLYGERWDHDVCTTRTTLQFTTETGASTNSPTVIDAQTIPSTRDWWRHQSQLDASAALDASALMDHHPLWQFNAVATVVLYGSTMDHVMARFEQLSPATMTPYTLARQMTDSPECHDWLHTDLSGGRVVVSVTRLPSTPSHDTIVTCRLATTTNEDMYRLLRYGLQDVPVDCYVNRTSGSHSAGPPPPRPRRPRAPPSDRANDTHDAVPRTIPPPSTTGVNLWLASLLTDSALPTGSFAHSMGLEVAHQLSLLIRTPTPSTMTTTDPTLADTAIFVQTVVQSTLQLAVPFIVTSWHQTNDVLQEMAPLDATDARVDDVMDTFLSEWMQLHGCAHAMLVSNGPACAASLDQGTNLWRVATRLVESTGPDTPAARILQRLSTAWSARSPRAPSGMHMALVFGVVTRILDVSQPVNDTADMEPLLHMFGYSVARDVVSSAVRLNVLGPMAGQSLLYHPAIQQATHRGIALAQNAMATATRTARDKGNQPSRVHVAMMAATGSAPILDVVHSCHDSLATRLFRS